MRSYQQEDIAMNEISDLNYNHYEILKKNNLPSDAEAEDTYEYVTGFFVVANRTVINKILYTSKHAPDMVLINVPPILRPNSQSGTLYFTFELTYMIELRKPAASPKGICNE